jgi:hypothetical protein
MADHFDSNIFFVDLQGFMDHRVFLIKELCILSARDNKIQHYIFKSQPFSWHNLGKCSKQQALWLTCYYHGISWSDGDLPHHTAYSCIQKLCEEPNAVIYVKGREKIEWLKYYGRNQNINCVNIEDIGCTINLCDLEYKSEVNKPHCNKHKVKLQCAYQNVLILRDWFTKHNE